MPTYTRLKTSRIEKIRDILDLNILNEHVVLAGGAVSAMINMDLPINDYDIFFVGLPNILRPIDIVANQHFIDTRETLLRNGFHCIFECPNQELFSFRKGDVKIQLITKTTYNSIETMLYTFDFYPCMCAFTNGEITVNLKETIRCCKFKRLQTHMISYPTSSLRRLIKYQNKGFYPTQECLKGIVYCINNLKLNDINMSFYFD